MHTTMKHLQYLFMTLSVLLLATPAFAQTGAGGDGYEAG